MTPLAALRHALSGDTGVTFVSGFRHPIGVGRACGWHRHDAIELVFHPTGRGTTKVADGRRIEFGPGAVVIYPAGEGHEQHMAVGGVDVCLQVVFRSSRPLVAGLLLAAVPTPRLRRELEDLATRHQAEDPLHRAELDHRAAALLCGLAAAPADDVDHATRARDLIAREYATLAGIDEVAGRLHLGADHLRHLFTARHGMGPGQWLLTVRVDRARDLLVRSNLPLAEVANACGFRSAHHLGAAFRRATGTTPIRWRRQNAPDSG